MTRCGTSAIKDACFQKICAERAGQQIDQGQKGPQAEKVTKL